MDIIGKALFAIAFFVPVLGAWLSRKASLLLRAVVTLAFIVLVLRLFAHVHVYFLDWLLYAAAVVLWLRDRRRLRVWALVVVSCLGLGWLLLYASLRTPIGDYFELRGNAAIAVGALKLHSLGPFVVPVLQSEQTMDPDVAAWALGRLGDPRYVPPLLGLLEKDGYEEAESAANALMAIGDDCAVPGLIAIATDPKNKTMAKRYARYAVARITQHPELRDFREELASSWWRDKSGGWKYTEREQIEVFRQWWQENKSRYPDRTTASFVPFPDEVSERSRIAFAWVLRFTALFVLAFALQAFLRGLTVERLWPNGTEVIQSPRVRLLQGVTILILAAVIWPLAGTVQGEMEFGFLMQLAGVAAAAVLSALLVRDVKRRLPPEPPGHLTALEAVWWILLIAGFGVSIILSERVTDRTVQGAIWGALFFGVLAGGTFLGWAVARIWLRLKHSPNAVPPPESGR